MNFKTLTRYSHIAFQNPKFNQSSTHPTSFQPSSPHISFHSFRNHHIRTNTQGNRFVIAPCISHDQDNNQNADSVSSIHEESEKPAKIIAANASIWNQMVEIAKFSGPATGLWLCGPLTSLIDTIVIGQSSSMELAALGPGTVLCDDLGYIFMFLSIATSNFVATALAEQGKDEVQHQISILLFIGLICGVFMFLFTRLLGAWALTAFTGAKNMDIIAAANTYVQIRGLAWPAVLVGWVAQSASLGMKDPWGPLKALAVASAINGIGVVVLCTFLGYGIAGAAWATMASQVVAGFMMIEALNKKGYNSFKLSVPTSSELQHIYTVAAPVLVLMLSKVAFYALLVYTATSMGIKTAAAHQVMIQMYMMCAIWAEPLCQTAQSFMPELIYGANRNLSRARMLLKSLLIIGVLSGILLGSIGTSIPWLFPHVFSPDADVIKEMHKVLIPYFIALIITPSTSGLEGTLLAGRDFKFISLSMSAIVFLGAFFVLLLSSRGTGFLGCWWALAAFQWSRFTVALRRLTLPGGTLYSDDLTGYELGKQINA